MKKKYLAAGLAVLMSVSMLTGCSGSTAETETEKAETEAEETEESEAETETSEEKVYTADEILSCLEYDIDDYVKLNDYMNMTVDVGDEAEVTDEEVEEMMEAFASMYPNTYVKSDRKTVEDGDRVNIDYTGYLDGQEFDGGSAEDYELTIGSDTFIDGFEDGLIGAKVGEETDVNVTFPDDYGVEELNGQKVVFQVTVNSIKEPKEISYEEIDDNWVEENFSEEDITTMEDFRAYVKQYLESLNDTDQDTLINNAIIDNIAAESEITIPDGYLEKRIELYKESVYAAVESSGQSFEDRMGVTEDEFLETLPASMETRVMKDLVLEAIVKDMDLEITQSEYNDYVNTYLSYYSFSEPEELYEQLAQLSELDGDDYCLLGYAEHQAWVQVKKSVTVTGESDSE